MIILEGYLKKWTNYINRWQNRYFILEDGILKFSNYKGQPEKGLIHLKIAKISTNPQDCLGIIINSGTKVVYIRANSILEKIKWLNAIRDQNQYNENSTRCKFEIPPCWTNNSLLSKTKNFLSNNESRFGNADKLNDNDHDSVKIINYIKDQINEVFKVLKNILLTLDAANLLTILENLILKLMEQINFLITDVKCEKSRLEKLEKKLDNILNTFDGIRINVDDGNNQNSCDLLDAKSFTKRGNSLRSEHNSAKENFTSIQKKISSSGVNSEQDITNLDNINNDIHPDPNNLYYINYDYDNNNEDGENDDMLTVKSVQINNDLKTQLDNDIENIVNNENIICINSYIRNESTIGKTNKKIKNNIKTNEDMDIASQKNHEIVDNSLYHSICSSRLAHRLKHSSIDNTIFQSFVHIDEHNHTKDSQNIIENNSGMFVSPVSYILHPQIKNLIDTNPIYHILDDWEKLTRSILPIKNTEIYSDDKPQYTENFLMNYSQMDLPIHYYEPISVLQRHCGNLQYSDLLNKADIEENACMRLGYVIAYAISKGSKNMDRLYKPFESFYGETYEYISVDKDIKHISEIISLDKSALASYTQTKSFEITSNVAIEYEYFGKYLEIKPIGKTIIYLKKHDDKIIFNNEITSLYYNSLLSTINIEKYGEIQFRNLITNETAIITFHSGSNNYLIKGHIKDKNYNTKYIIEGKWDQYLSVIQNDDHQQKKILWNKSISTYNEDKYKFSTFDIQLNHLNKYNIRNLPPTDSRFRSDIKALEQGNIKLAQQERVKNEEKYKKFSSNRNIYQKPLWFNEIYDPILNEKYYHYNGQYFQNKESDNFSNVISPFL